MLTRLTVIALFWAFTHYGAIINYAAAAEAIAAEVRGHETLVLSAGLGVGVGLVLFAFVIGTLGFHAQMYCLMRLAYLLGRSAVCALSMIAVLHRLAGGQDIWQEIGAAGAIVPFILFAAALAGIRLYDFNYPIRNRIVETAAVAMLSLLVVKGMAFL